MNSVQKLSQEDETSPSCDMTVSGTGSSLDVMGRCDGEIEKTIANQFTAERVLLQGIGWLAIIPKVKLKVALKKERELVEYKFLQA